MFLFRKDFIMIYADNAATTKMSGAAINAMLNCMEKTWGNPSSLYGLGQWAKESLEEARERIAACIGASPKEITFTSGGSEADNQAIRSAALLGARKGKRHIISTTFEHHAVLHTLKKLEREGFEVELLPVGELGTVTAQQVADAIREDTALVTIMYANNEIAPSCPSPKSAQCAGSGASVQGRRTSLPLSAWRQPWRMPVPICQRMPLRSLPCGICSSEDSPKSPTPPSTGTL